MKYNPDKEVMRHRYVTLDSEWSNLVGDVFVSKRSEFIVSWTGFRAYNQKAGMSGLEKS